MNGSIANSSSETVTGISRLIHLLKSMGPRWLCYRLWYAFQKKSGILRNRSAAASWDNRHLARFVSDPAFCDPSRYLCHRRSAPRMFTAPTQDALVAYDTDDGTIARADAICAGRFELFGCEEVDAGFPPDWHRNWLQPDLQLGCDQLTSHWSEISDHGAGDIKNVWELSRFGFVYDLVRAWGRTRDSRYVSAFWMLVEDWQAHNSPNVGPQWMCGQETTLRVMAWSFGLEAFCDDPATTAERAKNLASMIAVSGERIEANIAYALSHRNNHSICEAMGLWTIGTLFPEFKAAARWEANGRGLLEKLGRELIYNDGTFCQHSTNYHRFILVAYGWAFSIADRLNKRFSTELRERVGHSAAFLAEIVEPTNGRTQVFGGNDGANILPLSNCGYLDFRPAIQLASVASTGRPIFKEGPWDECLLWFGLFGADKSAAREPAACRDYGDGGYVVIRGCESAGIIRCARRYRHRPGHADQLHFDLWYRGSNVLRDGGSFSYNCVPWDEYFRGTVSHNTVQFDDHDQMPRLSRFLFGAWAPTEHIDPVHESKGKVKWRGKCTDWKGCVHERNVELDSIPRVWRILDRVSEYRDQAVIRWRLDPGMEWDLSGNVCQSDAVRIVVESEQKPVSIELSTGWESLYYWQRREIPVLEVRLAAPFAEVATTFELLRQNL